MITLQELAEQIMLDPFDIPRGKYDHLLEDLTQGIINNPKKRKDRTEDEVRRDCEASVLEHWVADNTEFEMNRAEFDVNDPRTYAFDLIHPVTKQSIEVKTCVSPVAKYWDIHKFSYVSTLYKHCNLVDFVYVASFTRKPEVYTITPRFLIPGPLFKPNLKESSFKTRTENYFDHRNIRDKIYFKGEVA